MTDIWKGKNKGLSKVSDKCEYTEYQGGFFDSCSFTCRKKCLFILHLIRADCSCENLFHFLCSILQKCR